MASGRNPRVSLLSTLGETLDAGVAKHKSVTNQKISLGKMKGAFAMMKNRELVQLYRSWCANVEAARAEQQGRYKARQARAGSWLMLWVGNDAKRRSNALLAG